MWSVPGTQMALLVATRPLPLESVSSGWQIVGLKSDG